jgi:hypothetical protein
MATARRPGDRGLVERRPSGARLSLVVLLARVPVASILAQYEPQQTHDRPGVWFHPSDCVTNEVLSGIRGAGLPIPVANAAGPPLIPRGKITVILWDEHSKLPPSPPFAPSQKLSAAPQKSR